MSWLLFIDESGQDRNHSPYEVLAGIAVKDSVLWPLISRINDAQEEFFGLRLFRVYGKEAKAKQLLKRKIFNHAFQASAIPNPRRRALAKMILEDGTEATREMLTALGQAKIAFCLHTLKLCKSYGCVAFGSIVPACAERPSGDFLRKDYSFLFERFYHFLNNTGEQAIGIIIFDELEKVQSHILLGQMEDYFLKTKNGRLRSKLILPQPLFVHSDLTTMVQMADLIAYIISWGVRLRGMTAERRTELSDLARCVLDLRYLHEAPGGTRTWGFKLIESLLPSQRLE